METSDSNVKAIAFYLPQYHPIKENNEWWGNGFTEWRNVNKAKPNFDGHYQPHQPADLGYYDLRLPETRQLQADLAKRYGIFGFCYYYYWFSGKRLLERPLDDVLRLGEPDLPFCVCWANENWTRTWDGLDKHILIAQKHEENEAERFINDLIPIFKDSRYIKVNGKPMLLVYRVDILPNCAQTAEIWRKIAKQNGFPDLYLCAVQFYGISDPRPFGFDSAIEFPPHGFLNDETIPEKPISYTNSNYSGGGFDYNKVINFALAKSEPNYPWHRGIMPSWDNTPRRQDTSHHFINSNPAAYEYWLSQIVKQSKDRNTEEDKFVFINAWNEWGEGCHLEPDLKYGHAYLRATWSGLNNLKAGIDHLAEIIKKEDTFVPSRMVKEISEIVNSRNNIIAYLSQELNVLQNEVNLLRIAKRRKRDILKKYISYIPYLKPILKNIVPARYW